LTVQIALPLFFLFFLWLKNTARSPPPARRKPCVSRGLLKQRAKKLPEYISGCAELPMIGGNIAHFAVLSVTQLPKRAARSRRQPSAAS
jgi:hypothetical protein